MPVILLVGLLLFAPSLSAAQLPDWMEHWEFAMNVEEDDGPDYFIDPILPLYRSASGEQLVFVEPRLRYADGEFLFNNGLGIRQLVSNRAWLLGANMFHDYETEHSHYRLGWGLEALSSYAEARFNYYLALSQQRLVYELGSVRNIEEAVDGFDFELGVPVPHYSRLKVFMGYNWYNFEKFKNQSGWTMRTEYTPVPFIVIDGLLSNDTKSNLDWGMTVALRLPFGRNDPTTARSLLKFDDTMFPESDASEHLFRLVERHHEIVVERRQETGGITVEIGRGT